MTYQKELKTALKAAKAAGKVQLKGLSQLKKIEFKEDHSPVTVIDRQCEDIIRGTILKAFPDDGFLGEESGYLEGKSGRRWIVDPLDGTRPYLRGIPTFSVLIALEDKDRFIVGVMYFPALKETYFATEGSGAFLNDRPIHVSRTDKLNKVMGTSQGFVEKADTDEGKKLFELMKKWDYNYGFMDAYSYASLAAGRLDLAVNLIDKPWDCAAAACVISEAGGQYSDIAGKQTIYEGSIVFSNGKLHQDALAQLAS